MGTTTDRLGRVELGLGLLGHLQRLGEQRRRLLRTARTGDGLGLHRQAVGDEESGVGELLHHHVQAHAARMLVEGGAVGRGRRQVATDVDDRADQATDDRPVGETVEITDVQHPGRAGPCPFEQAHLRQRDDLVHQRVCLVERTVRKRQLRRPGPGLSDEVLEVGDPAPLPHRQRLLHRQEGDRVVGELPWRQGNVAVDPLGGHGESERQVGLGLVEATLEPPDHALSRCVLGHQHVVVDESRGADVRQQLVGPLEIAPGAVVSPQRDQRGQELVPRLLGPGDLEAACVVDHRPWVGVARRGHVQEPPFEAEVGFPEPHGRGIREARQQVDGEPEMVGTLFQCSSLAVVVRGRLVRTDCVVDPTGGVEVGGDGAPGSRAARCPGPAKRQSDPTVHVDPLILRHQVIGDVPDEDVAEPVRGAVGAGFGLDQSGEDQRLDGAVHRLGGSVGHIGEEADVERPADGGRGLRQTDVGALRVETGEQRLVQRRRHPRVLAHRVDDLLFDGDVLGREACQLLEEQRVALGPAQHDTEMHGIEVVVDVSGEEPRLVLVERGQIDGEEALPSEAMAVGPLGGHEADAVQRVSDEAREQLTGRRVDPLDIVDLDDEWRSGGDRFQPLSEGGVDPIVDQRDVRGRRVVPGIGTDAQHGGQERHEGVRFQVHGRPTRTRQTIPSRNECAPAILNGRILDWP